MRKKLWYEPVSTCLGGKSFSNGLEDSKESIGEHGITVEQNIKKGTGANDESEHALIISTPYTLKLIKDAVVLIQIAKLAAEVVVDRNGLYRA
jgi:hypothetical protein